MKDITDAPAAQEGEPVDAELLRDRLGDTAGAREAWEILEDTERRTLRLRRESPLRQEHLESIAHAKKVARVPRPPPR